MLTGLAAFDRVELRTRLLENADLRPMIDLEPYLRDIIRAFYASQFKEGLALLEKYSVSSVSPLRCRTGLAMLRLGDGWYRLDNTSISI